MTQTKDQERNLATITAMGEAFNRKDLDAIARLFAQDAVYEDFQGSAPQGNRYVGPVAIRAVFAEQFRSHPNYHFEDHTPLVSGEYGALEYTVVFSGTPERRIKMCDFFEFRAGKVARKSTWVKTIK